MVIDRDAALREFAAGLGDGSTVLAAAPSIIEALEPNPNGLDLISYTESPETRQAFQAEATLLYAPAEEAAKEAARLLNRRRTERHVQPGQVLVRPHILDLQVDGQG
jgi:hypothetical protein